ncbi:hypothetical protein KEF85_01530 [Methylomonas paludis]|uniref:Uncharacterized protein n=1 Tax=Methylomonas paludis TaxID=1173101 RepID=A0A975MP45_9GAMM|nr:hypothetical protein [Methylomonas paludis]QWF71205.1 hypothetical protein KEF85_01530 [Methylomonas paludis]
MRRKITSSAQRELLAKFLDGGWLEIDDLLIDELVTNGWRFKYKSIHNYKPGNFRKLSSNSLIARRKLKEFDLLTALSAKISKVNQIIGCISVNEYGREQWESLLPIINGVLVNIMSLRNWPHSKEQEVINQFADDLIIRVDSIRASCFVNQHKQIMGRFGTLNQLEIDDWDVLLPIIQDIQSDINKFLSPDTLKNLSRGEL